MQKRKTITVMITFLGAALFLNNGVGAILVTSHGSTGAIAGVVVPLYAYATDSSWTSLIKIAQSYPEVPMMAIVNPSNGVGSSRDTNFVSGINQLKASGIRVLGYVDTLYSKAGVTNVE